MKSMSEVTATLERAVKEMPTWNLQDQLVFQLKMVEFATLADAIMAEYDGRVERLNRVMESLKGGNDD